MHLSFWVRSFWGLTSIDFVVGYGSFGVLECLVGSGLL